MIAHLIAVIVATEAIVELIVSADITLWVRKLASDIDKILGILFFGKLFSCGYCMSVWVAAILFLWIPNWVLLIIIAHRASNVLHELFSRWFHRMPFTLVFNHVHTNVESEVDDGNVRPPVGYNGENEEISKS